MTATGVENGKTITTGVENGNPKMTTTGVENGKTTGNPKEMEKENTTTGMKALGETGKTKKQQDPKAEKEAAVANSFKLTKARVETVKVTTKVPETGTKTPGVENSTTNGPENGTMNT